MTTLARIPLSGPSGTTDDRTHGSAPARPGGAASAFEDVLGAEHPEAAPPTSSAPAGEPSRATEREEHAAEGHPGAGARAPAEREEEAGTGPETAAGPVGHAAADGALEPRRKGRVRHGRAAAGQGERDAAPTPSAGAAPAAQVAAQLAVQAAAGSRAPATTSAAGSEAQTGAPVSRHARRAAGAPEADEASSATHAAKSASGSSAHPPRPGAEQPAGAAEKSGAAEHPAPAAAGAASAKAPARPSARSGEASERVSGGAAEADPGADARAAASLQAAPPRAGAVPLAELAEPARMRVPVPSPLSALPIEPGEALISGAVTPGAAHLHVSSDTLGDLALHLRIQDGAAHVRVEGGSRAAVEARAPELARALAAEGIGLAKLEHEPNAGNPQQGGAGAGGPSSGDLSGDRRESGDGRGASGAEEGALARAPARPGSAPARTHTGRLDVTA